MQDTPNLNRKLKEYAKRIKTLKEMGATLSEINYYRRELNRTHERIRERDKNRKKNIKQHRKAN